MKDPILLSTDDSEEAISVFTLDELIRLRQIVEELRSLAPPEVRVEHTFFKQFFLLRTVAVESGNRAIPYFACDTVDLLAYPTVVESARRYVSTPHFNKKKKGKN